MKKALLLMVVIGYSVVSTAQSNEIVPIILDGKPAYLNVTTGKVVSKKSATATKYKKIKLNNFSNATSVHNNVAAVVYSAEGTHAVSSGETLYSISKLYGLSVSALKELNNLSSNTLSVGQTLQLNENEKTKGNSVATAGSTHVVVSGETLYAISRKYNLSVSKLKMLNNLTSNIITIGDELVIE